MASKWAHLRGKVPVEKTERQQDVEAKLKEYGGKPIDDLTKTYNEKVSKAKELAAEAKDLKVEAESLDILIRKKLDAEGADAFRINGYTWSETFEPYPIAEDPAAIVKYFKEHGMEDQLALTTTELASRLKTFVKAEAENNELQIETKEEPGPDGPMTITIVRSQIPGVRVFLKTGLSRVKSGKGAA